MVQKKNIIQEKSFDFALDIIKLYKQLSEQKEYIVSKQILRSGTSIGANIEEALVTPTKKDFINSTYMQIGFSKNISENLIDDLLSTIIESLKKEKKLKLSKFGTFSVRSKKSRIGRNPLTKEEKVITDRDVILFKPSKEFKDLVNSTNDS